MGFGLNFSIPTRGAGTRQNGPAATACAIVPNSGTLQGDLVVVVCYASGDCSKPTDGGDPWRILDSGYDSGNTFGIFMAACIAPRAGSSGWPSLPFGATMAYSAQTFSYAQPGPYMTYDLRNYIGSTRGLAGWFNAAASSTALDSGEAIQTYPICLDLIGRGSNNAGVSRTVANITGFTERFDTNNTTSQCHIALNDAISYNRQPRPSVTSALSAACVKRAGVRALIPIIGDTKSRHTMQPGRRFY